MYFTPCEQLIENALWDMYDFLESPLFNSPCSSKNNTCSYSTYSPFYFYSVGEKSCTSGKKATKSTKSTFHPNWHQREDAKNYYIQVELPGVAKDAVKMELNEEERRLTISGERKLKEKETEQEEVLPTSTSEESNLAVDDKAPENENATEPAATTSTSAAASTSTSSNKKYSLRECFDGSFERTFLLPEDADLEQLQASMANGLLEITVPKVQPVQRQPRTIEIQ